MDEGQYKELIDALIGYAKGEFNFDLSPKHDSEEADTFRIAIKMLGEELEEKTVSSDYFYNIFNEVSSLILLTDLEGNVLNFNKAVADWYPNLEKGASIDEVLGLQTDINLNSNKTTLETQFQIQKANKEKVPVLIKCKKITDNYSSKAIRLFIIQDITDIKTKENLVLRKIVETQEQERDRISKDLHDDLGQELTAAFMLFSSISQKKIREDKIFMDGLKILSRTVDRIREICFNMMPSTLVEYTIKDAIEQLISYIQGTTHIEFVTDIRLKEKIIAKQVEVAIYRIVQEFTSNAIKYSDTDLLTINLIVENDKIFLNLRDYGSGFNYEKVKKKCRGINNMKSRVRAYSGDISFISNKDRGVLLKAEIPNIDFNEL